MREEEIHQRSYDALKSLLKARQDLTKAKRNNVIMRAGKRFGLAEQVIKELQEYYNGNNLEGFLILLIQKLLEEGIMIVDSELKIGPRSIVYEIPNTGVIPTRRKRIEEPIIRAKIVRPESSQSNANQTAEVPNQTKTNEVKEVKKLVLKTLKHVDISELSAGNESIDRFLKQLCIEGITLNEVEITDRGKEISDLKYIEIYERIESRLREISSKLREINTFGFRKIYGEDVIRVFRWIIGKEKSTQDIYQDIKFRENKVINCDPERILRVKEAFRNEATEGLDLCTMIFIIERLKSAKINYSQYYKISNNSSYNNDKNKVEEFFNKLFGIENEKKSEQMER